MVYRGTEAYDFSLFEPQVIEEPVKKNNSSKDKKRTKQPATKSAPKKSKVAGMISDYECEVERNAKKSAVPDVVKKVMCFCAVFFVMAVVLLVMQTKCDVLMSEIATVQGQIEIAESENVRLNAELSSLMSSDKIENYAENVLGMVKAESYQISYIDLSQGDEVVVSGDKTLDDGEDAMGKIKALFAYIF